MLLPTCYKQLNSTNEVNEPFTKCILWSVRRAQFEASFQTSVGSVLTCTRLKKTRTITIWNGPKQTNLYMMTKHYVIDHSAGHETLCTKAKQEKKKKILFKIWMNRLPNIYIDSKYLVKILCSMHDFNATYFPDSLLWRNSPFLLGRFVFPLLSTFSRKLFFYRSQNYALMYSWPFENLKKESWKVSWHGLL